jgi:arabinofuranosyltransferase
MELSLTKIRNIHIFSTIASAVSLAAAIAGKMSNISILLTGILLLAHLPMFWITRKSTHSDTTPPAWMQTPAFAQIGFLLTTSLFSVSLGFLSWIFLFESGSQVRNVLIRLSPVIGWGVVVTGYLLAALGGVLNRGTEKRDGTLIGAVLFSVIGHLFLFWLSSQIFSYTIDDAYITFRYSKNLAAGFGPTYNPGLPPVEGYTTFLWMLLMTTPHFIGVNVATFSKVLGVLLTCGTFALISLITFQLTRIFPLKARLAFSTFGAYLLAMLPITSIHAIAGMETSLFVFLTAEMVYLISVGLSDEPRLLFWSPMVGLLIGMTRPEGNAIVLLLLAVAWFLSTRDVRKRLTWYSLGLYILPGAIYFLWRYLYYDLPLPLPFYMKVLHGAGLFGGAYEVGTYLLYLLPSLGLLLLVGMLRLRREQYALIIPVVFLLVFYLFPVHAMGFSWRFIYPATPFISILAAIGGLTVFDLLRGAIRSSKPWEPLVLAGLLLIGFSNLQNLNGMIRDSQLYAAGISNYKTFGELLSDYNDQHEYTLAIGDAGTVPYYSDWQAIDLFGLNSREVAFGSVDVFTLVFEAQPADLILLSAGPNPNRISEEHAGAQNLYEEALKHGMAHVGTFAFGRVNNIWVVGYPETGLANYLQENMDFKGTNDGG